jgi:fructoselysine 6-phosphate deglycase
MTALPADFRPAGFDRAALIAELAPTIDGLAAAMEFGREIAPRIDRVIFLACGSPNRAMRGLQYWIERLSPGLEVRRYFPAEFVAQDPPRRDGRTLVILGSKSGTTPETLAAAEFLRGGPCVTVAITQSPDSPLARAVQHRFLIGETPESFLGLAMVAHALVGGLLAGRGDWPHAGALRAGLGALPAAVADAAAAADARGAAAALALRADRHIYLLAAGPCFTNAYVFGVCILMEMLWLHAYPVDAAEFFHGPFEIVERDTPLIVILGEDPSRPLAERALRFCERQSDRVFPYDSRDLAMPGIAPEIRPILAPFALQGALKRISANLALLHGKKLGERRYMWKGGY